MQVLLAAAFGAVLVAVSSLTYLVVERPMQAAGRRVARWLDARFGPDRQLRSSEEKNEKTRYSERPLVTLAGRPPGPGCGAKPGT